MKALPTLSASGWLTDPKEILHQAFLHLYVTSKDQSNEYYGAITSIRNILDENSYDLTTTINALETRLKRFFEAYFDKVDVNIKDITEGDGSKRNLHLDLIVYDKGEEYSLNTLLDPQNPPTTRMVIDKINA